MITYAVYAHPVDPTEERGSIPYWFPDLATVTEIGEYPTRARATRKAVDHKNRYWVGVQVVKLTYDDDGNETDEQILDSFHP